MLFLVNEWEQINVLYMGFLFLQDPVVHFDLPLKLESWFPRQKVRKKREEIRDLVLHLYRFQQGSLGNYSSDDGKETGI